MNRLSTKIGALACALALVGGVMAGCSQATSQLSEEQQANRAYMSQVNEAMDELDIQLDSFVDAVSRGDIVNMRSQANNAYQAIDKLSSLEVPEAFKDVQQDYVNGTAKLREALDSYVKLYTEINAGTFDQSTYSARIDAVQKLYDEGVDALKKADETAASK